MFVNIVLEEDCAYNGGLNRSPDGDVFFLLCRFERYFRLFIKEKSEQLIG